MQEIPLFWEMNELITTYLEGEKMLAELHQSIMHSQNIKKCEFKCFFFFTLAMNFMMFYLFSTVPPFMVI